MKETINVNINGEIYIVSQASRRCWWARHHADRFGRTSASGTTARLAAEEAAALSDQ